MAKINWKTVLIQWHDEAPEINNIEQTVRDDCEKNLKSLNKVSDLIFHHVFLGKSHFNDVINVWGEDDDETLHCEYVAEVSQIDIDDDE